MPTWNDITGDTIRTRVSNDNFRNNFDNIQFGVNKPKDEEKSEEVEKSE